MVKLFKTLINNGFVVLGLLIVVTLYLAYSQKPQPLKKPSAHTPPETATPPVVAEAESSAPAETQPAEPAAENTPESTEANTQPATTPAAPAETEKTATDTSATTEPPAKAAMPPEPAHPAQTADTETPAQTTAKPATPTAPALAETSTPEVNKTEEAKKTDSKPESTTLANGLLFDPAKVPPQAILSRFPNLQAALAEAERARAEGDLNWAAAIYAALLHYYPRSDIAGTLGNIFWQLGDKTWAHRAWRYAAQLLIKEGRPDIAAKFAHNIEKLDPALSQEIRAHLPKTTQPEQKGKAN